MTPSAAPHAAADGTSFDAASEAARKAATRQAGSRRAASVNWRCGRGQIEPSGFAALRLRTRSTAGPTIPRAKLPKGLDGRRDRYGPSVITRDRDKHAGPPGSSRISVLRLRQELKDTTSASLELPRSKPICFIAPSRQRSTRGQRLSRLAKERVGVHLGLELLPRARLLACVGTRQCHQEPRRNQTAARHEAAKRQQYPEPQAKSTASE